MGNQPALDINKLLNVPTSLNNLKTKVNDLDVFKLKTVPVELRKLSYIEDKEVVKNTKINRLKTKTKTKNLETKMCFYKIHYYYIIDYNFVEFI